MRVDDLIKVLKRYRGDLKVDFMMENDMYEGQYYGLAFKDIEPYTLAKSSNDVNERIRFVFWDYLGERND